MSMGIEAWFCCAALASYNIWEHVTRLQPWMALFSLLYTLVMIFLKQHLIVEFNSTVLY